MKPLRQALRDATRSIELRTRAIYLASRDRRVPAAAKALAVFVAAYALSPIDLIPDVIPVLGFVDDLVLVPLGIALVVRLIPRDVWRECLDAAQQQMDARLPRSRLAALVIVLIWIVMVALLALLLWRKSRTA